MHDPITYFQGAILGLIQGVAEPFPISSLGHGVILPRLAHWDIHQNDKFFLTFLIATHLATAIVLFFFFLRDWGRILSGIVRSLRDLAAVRWGAEELVAATDRLPQLRAAAADRDPAKLRRGVELVEETRQGAIYNVTEELALEALASRLLRVLA